MLVLRITIAVMGFLAAIVLNPWVPAIAIIALAFLFRAWEALLLGLFIDLVWSPVSYLPVFTIGAIIIVWVFEPIRKEFLV
ncbi:hypothetical protein C4568_00950 [Candidatus Parcubacteria bacterium]|nr:MAG: hypothetical protein C4568_00950 [Candidatus Parcubacteria bacterium]